MPKAIVYEGPVSVSLDTIDDHFRPASEMRACLSKEAVEEYSERLVDMPPVKLMHDAKADICWVVDGAHTLVAHVRKGQRVCPAMVAEGSYLTAWQTAARENDKHGVRITPGDKRARVLRAFKVLPEINPKGWPWSMRRIADWCGVSHTAVEQLATVASCPWLAEPTTGLDGKTRASPAASSAAESNGQHEPEGETEDESEDESKDDAPSAGQSPSRATNPDSAFKTLMNYLDKTNTLLASVEAANTQQRHGWGGFANVAASFTPGQRHEIQTHLADLLCTFQEWVEVLREMSHETKAG